MTFVSYAQNFEDVLLWRALRSVGTGFYIDAGAGHPDIDSVTRAFYDRGWHGVNIEPVPEDARRLRASRLRDTTLEFALGEAAGEMVFHVVEGTGLSTGDAAAAAGFAADGHTVVPIKVRVETLAQLCRDHAASEIHFLKVDVEGAERQVLSGGDFAAFRPWIVLVEATAPTSRSPTHTAWEGLLLDAGYRFAWFDGLNRFYLAAERWEALASHFQVAPNVFDDFVRVADTEWARRIERAEAQAGEWRVRASVAEQRLADESRAMAAALGTADRRLTEHMQLRAETKAMTARLQEAEGALLQARQWLYAMRASTSWRATSLLRAGAGLVQLATGRGPRPFHPPPELDATLLNAPSDEPPVSISGTIAERPVALPPPVANVSTAARLTRTVHQFHSGSATGDAVTNAMFLIRRLLRDVGYESEIYVEHLDPALAAELRPLRELPAHDGYVLLLHHSIGYDAFDAVARLPAPKVLLYHNITPPDLLADMPVMAAYAQLGRRQLAALRGHVAAAVAFSEYSATELRGLGFAPVQTAALLFDLDVLRARAVPCRSSRHGTDGIMPRGVRPFTVLFVGRLVASKAQDELVAAYREFRKLFAAPSRLVLVGRGDGGTYENALRAQAMAPDLAEHVTLTGPVSEEALSDWFAQADLYVSLSRHEGFGIPIVEAMAAEVPVLAWPAGAVSAVLDDEPGLLAERTPSAVAAAMAALANDPVLRAATASRQSRSLDRFALGPQAERLMLALARAGAMPPPEPGLRARYARALRFAVTGHVNKTYSLAAINRTVALAIEAARPGMVRLLPVEGRPTTDLSEVPLPEYDRIAALVARPRPDAGPEVVISQHYPVHVPPGSFDASMAMFFWEESLVPRETVSGLVSSFRAVLAPSTFVSKTMLDSGVSLPVRTVGYAPDLSAWQAIGAARMQDGPRRSGKFTFLHVSSCFPRKGIDLLLAAYAAQFRSTDAVRLVIKGFPNPHNDAAAQVDKQRLDDPGCGEIVLVDRDLDADELMDLYRDADVLVLPTRGEGFNLPAAEAMAAGLPLIVTGFGGHMDFVTADTARLLDYQFAPSRSHLARGASLWVEPDVADLGVAMRETFNDPAAASARALRAMTSVADRLDPARFVARLTDAALDTLLPLAGPPPRIAWVSTWAVRCGVGEYSRLMLEQWQRDSNLAGQGAAGPITVLCDERTSEQAAPPALPGAEQRAAWRVGDPSVETLAAAIARSGARIVVVQHQPGLLPWDGLAALLVHPALAGRVVSVTLHNTRNLLDLEAEPRAATIAALQSATRVIVHTVADLNLMKSLGLVGNVTMIPQGAPSPAAAPGPSRQRAIRSLRSDDAPLVGCYGFFLPDKGIAELIAALGRLRTRWPKARLRLVCAEHDSPVSGKEILARQAQADAAGLSEAIEWHTDFLPTDQSLDLLAACDLIVLPYQASKEASSAAMRTALCAGVPVAVTPLPLFAEAEDAVARIEAIDEKAIARGITELLLSAERRTALQSAARVWVEAHDWGDIAWRMHGMLLGLFHAQDGTQGGAD